MIRYGYHFFIGWARSQRVGHSGVLSWREVAPKLQIQSFVLGRGEN